ncbi:levanase [Klebsiella michiganensis]|uniref:Levanase n=1 Tax=Klebsiella michiganensis TaxID=1134687 RepID=A0A7H4LXY8_9ENTR|nr:levanase [Klebsiella michiganensis]
MVAMYTSYYPTDMTLDNGKTIAAGTQAQSIAYSLDKRANLDAV